MGKKKAVVRSSSKRKIVRSSSPAALSRALEAKPTKGRTSAKKRASTTASKRGSSGRDPVTLQAIKKGVGARNQSIKAGLRALKRKR